MTTRPPLPLGAKTGVNTSSNQTGDRAQILPITRRYFRAINWDFNGIARSDPSFGLDPPDP